MDIDIVTYILYNDIQRRFLIINNKIQLIKHLKPATSRYPLAVMLSICYQFFGLSLIIKIFFTIIKGIYK
jgi:uncharacterized membrane protein